MNNESAQEPPGCPKAVLYCAVISVLEVTPDFGLV